MSKIYRIPKGAPGYEGWREDFFRKTSSSREVEPEEPTAGGGGMTDAKENVGVGE